MAMATMKVTVVGQELFDTVEDAIDLVGVNNLNEVNSGMLGNLKTLTYEFGVDEGDVIKKRKRLMDILYEDRKHLVALYEHGDWMSMWVVKPVRKELAK